MRNIAPATAVTTPSRAGAFADSTLTRSPVATIEAPRLSHISALASSANLLASSRTAVDTR
jgi:hypothetical protein